MGGGGILWLGSRIHDNWKDNTRGPAMALEHHHRSTMHREREEQEESSAGTRIYWSGSAQFISTTISPGTDKLAVCRNDHSQSLSKVRKRVPYQCTAKGKNLTEQENLNFFTILYPQVTAKTTLVLLKVKQWSELTKMRQLGKHGHTHTHTFLVNSWSLSQLWSLLFSGTTIAKSWWWLLKR